MYYVMRILNFLDSYRIAILSALFGALVLFAVVNWLYDPYRKQNKKLRVCTKGMRSYPSKAALYMARLPEDYRRQWRAFVNCGTDKPALVFEFIPRRKRLLAPRLLIALSVLMSLYVAVFAAVGFNFVYVVLQIVFWLALALIFCIDRVVARRYTRRAKRTFGQLVAQLSAVVPKKPSTLAEDTVTALNKLNKSEVDDKAVGQASEILRRKGLNEERTVEEQRRINLALNGLLQAYAANSQHKPV